MSINLVRERILQSQAQRWITIATSLKIAAIPVPFEALPNLAINIAKEDHEAFTKEVWDSIPMWIERNNSYIGAFITSALKVAPNAIVSVQNNPSGITLAVETNEVSDDGKVKWHIGEGCWASCGVLSGEVDGKKCAETLLREAPQRQKYRELQMEPETEETLNEMELLRFMMQSI